MRRLSSFLGAIAFASATFAVPVFAQSATTNQTMDDCKLIPDDTARLACYDRVIKAGRANVPGPSESAAASGVGSGGGAAGGGGTGTGTGNKPMTAEERREANQKAFGLPAYAKPETPEQKQEKVEELTTQIATLGVTGPNLLRVTTTDGQVWDQIEGDAQHAKVGDTIVVKRNFMGGTKCRIGRAPPYRCIRADRPGQS
jgi:hypothetical protein